MTKQYPEQRAHFSGNGEQHQQPQQQPQPPRRRVHGYAPPIELPDVEHDRRQQPSRDCLTEEDEALLGYPETETEAGPTRSSTSRGWMQRPSSQEMIPYQDVDMLNIIVTPRRSAQQPPQPSSSQRAPRRYRHQEAEEGEPLTAERSRPPALLAPPSSSSKRPGLLHRLHLDARTALLLGIVGTLGLVVLFSNLTQDWQGWQEQWQYGYPRTSQTDAVVGHNHDSAAHPSHFLAENLRGTVVVIEFPAGDTTHAIAYEGPHLSGPGVDATPVTLTFTDVTGDGTPDMIIHAGIITAVFVNDPAHNDFRPLRPGDHLISGSLSWSPFPASGTAASQKGGAHGQS